jgi:hypothetical protein
MRSFALLLLGLLGVIRCSAIIDFQQMPVRELRAYLAARNAVCFGCTEKLEFVAKAVELSKEGAQTKTKTKSKPKSEISRLTKDNITLPSLSEVYIYVCLIASLIVAVWQFVWPEVRRMIYTWNKHTDAITQELVREPYKLGCCGQVCDRRALALMMQNSQLVRVRSVRRRNRPVGKFERVAQCHLCRGVFEPSYIRSLLNEFNFDTRVTGEFYCESSICDPAFARGEAEREHFYWIRTREQVKQQQDEARRNFVIEHVGDSSLNESSSTSPEERRNFDVAPGTTPFAPVSTDSTWTALEENESFFTTEQLLQLRQVSRSCSMVCDVLLHADATTGGGRRGRLENLSMEFNTEPQSTQ